MLVSTPGLFTLYLSLLSSKLVPFYKFSEEKITKSFEEFLVFLARYRTPSQYNHLRIYHDIYDFQIVSKLTLLEKCSNPR